jgi:hypothetical protein
MADKMKIETTSADLPPMPAKDAGPDEWRRYHEALFKAGKLAMPEPAKV